MVALYKMGFDNNNNNNAMALSHKLSAGSADFKSNAIFSGIADALAQDGENLVKKVKGVYAFKVKGAGGKIGLWIVDAKNGSGKVEFEGKGRWAGKKPWIFLTPHLSVVNFCFRQT